MAIEIILPQYANLADFIRRFEAEAQLVARLEHPLCSRAAARFLGASRMAPTW